MNAGLVEMFEYNRWANGQLIAACRNVPDEAMDGKVEGVSGTVRSLLIHLVGGQQTFALRTEGRQHEGELTRSSPFPGLDELSRLEAESAAALIEIARSLDGDESAVLGWQGKNFEFPVRFFLTHAIAHAAEHRTEIKVALGHVGVATPDLDGWVFGQAKGYGREV